MYSDNIRKLYEKYNNKNTIEEINDLENKIKEKELILYKANLEKLIKLFPIITDVLMNTDIFEFFDKYKSSLRFAIPSNKYDNIDITFNLLSQNSSINSVVFKTHSYPKHIYEIFIDDKKKREDREKNYIFDDWEILNDLIDITLSNFEVKLENYLSDRDKHLVDLRNKYDKLSDISKGE